MDLEQELRGLLLPTEAARFMDMSLNRFKYHLKNPLAPKPLMIGRFKHPFYWEHELKHWKPRRKRK